jgi:hypothetical protein
VDTNKILKKIQIGDNTTLFVYDNRGIKVENGVTFLDKHSSIHKDEELDYIVTWQ